MSIRYKVDILERLKAAGYNTTRLRAERILGESVLQKMRNKKPLSWHELSVVCELLRAQPGDLIEYVED